MSASEWFRDWLQRHEQLHPNRSWLDPDTDEGEVFFSGWIAAFDEKSISLQDALDSSEYLQRVAPGYPERHLKAILDNIEIVRHRRRSTPGNVPVEGWRPGQERAAQASAECPECNGTGWAERRALVPGFESPFVVRLYCRCAYGLWRELNRGRADLTRSGEQNYESLQALPRLWRTDLEHETWISHPTTPLVGDRPNVAYLAPDDPRRARRPVRETSRFLRRADRERDEAPVEG